MFFRDAFLTPMLIVTSVYVLEIGRKPIQHMPILRRAFLTGRIVLQIPYHTFVPGPAKFITDLSS